MLRKDLYTADAAKILRALSWDGPSFIWENGKSYIGLSSCAFLPSNFSELQNIEEHKVSLGFIAYDALRFIEDVDGVFARDGIPDFYFLTAEKLVEIDHENKELIFTGFSDSEISDFSINFEQESTTRNLEEGFKFVREEFIGLVQRAQEYIGAGDIFQVVLSNELKVNESICPLSLYSYLFKNNPSPYHFLVKFNDKTLVGASPETFLRTEGRKITMRPIAGTYPSSVSEREIAQFREDYKERAEHIMLVDHARNDLGRVSKKGSVVVEEMLSVESYEKVHHLVSKVSGVLKDEETIYTAIFSCFPIATLTGTPKVRAMEIINELEGGPRGIFGGAVCAFLGNGEFDSAVAIRSAVVSEDEVLIQGGAGIVYDSVPEREYEECIWKMQSVIEGVRNS